MLGTCRKSAFTGALTDIMCGHALSGEAGELWRWSTLKLAWEQLGSVADASARPSTLEGQAMVAIGSFLYVFGGSDDGE